MLHEHTCESLSWCTSYGFLLTTTDYDDGGQLSATHLLVGQELLKSHCDERHPRRLCPSNRASAPLFLSLFLRRPEIGRLGTIYQFRTFQHEGKSGGLALVNKQARKYASTILSTIYLALISTPTEVLSSSSFSCISSHLLSSFLSSWPSSPRCSRDAFQPFYLLSFPAPFLASFLRAGLHIDASHQLHIPSLPFLPILSDRVQFDSVIQKPNLNPIGPSGISFCL